ncbi:MAG: DUF2341 domain-containing protein [Bacteroidales bacterium]|nr:DUF2341 domain-containing protein [Bacteroidales bacterium]
MKKITFIWVVFFHCFILFSQGVAISPIGSQPHPSAALDIQFTDKGILIPRVSLNSTTQFNPPINGPEVLSLLIYNENELISGLGADGKGFYFWNGNQWEKVGYTKAWYLTGNANTNPSTHYLGTIDSSHLIFRTYSTEQMRISASGNIGIHQSQPSALVHITNDNNNLEPLIIETPQYTPAHYRRPIYIDATNRTDTLLNYQILLILNTQSLIASGKMQPDCDDIRFYTPNGTPIYYWIEDGCNTPQTWIWIRIPTIYGGRIDSIYLEYGFPNLGPGANGDSTFVFFDDFVGSSINTIKWQQWSSNYTISNGIITCWGSSPNLFARNINNGGIVPTMPTYRIKHRAITYAGNNCLWGCTSWDQFIAVPATTVFWGPWNGGFNTYLLDVVNNNLQNQNVTNWFKAEVTYDGNIGKFFFNNSYVSQVSATGKTLQHIYLYSCCRNSYDWIFLAKYVNPEPNITIGNEITIASSWVIKPVVYIKPSGEVGIQTTQPTYALQVGNPGDGNRAISNAWITFSSSQWKSNIRPLEIQPQKLQLLQPVTFEWTTSHETDLGLIAEEVAKTFPMLVQYGNHGEILGIKYDRLSILLLEAIKTQQKEIEDLKKELEQLRKKNKFRRCSQQ